MKKILLSFFTISCMVSGFAQTQLIENFNYTINDSLAATNVNNNWAIISGSTVNAIRANGTSLTFTGYNGSGIGPSVTLTTTGQDIYRDFTSSISASNVYCSFLLNVSAAQANGDYFFAYLPNTSTVNYTGRVFVKSNGTGYSLGISKSSETAVYSTNILSFNTTYMLVVKYVYNSTGTTDDQCGIYVFPSTIPTTEPTSFDVGVSAGTITDLANVSRVALRQGTASNAPTLSIDGIRVSNTWANGPLPVKLVNFSASLNNNQTELNWSTASETNNKGFEVERSIDGVNFETIGFVKGNGNSNRINKYSFIDANQSSAFYRLKQIDFDGQFEYSSTVKVSNDELLVDLTPNPFNDNLVINSPTMIENAEIIDVTGKVKLMEIVNSNRATINTSTLSNGIYFIRINNGQKVITKRIIKN